MLDIWHQPWKRAGQIESSGLIDGAAKWILALLSYLSAHHWLQFLFQKTGREQATHYATDLYFLAWLVVVLWCFYCSAPGAALCGPPSVVFIWLVRYRLAEALLREIWVVLYRGNVTSSPARVVIVALINYGTIVGLFGYLYGGQSGFMQATSIGFTFSPLNPATAGALAILQCAYCFVFTLLILGSFIARIQLEPHILANDAKPAVSSARNGGIADARAALDGIERDLQECNTKLASTKASLATAQAHIEKVKAIAAEIGGNQGQGLTIKDIEERLRVAIKSNDLETR